MFPNTNSEKVYVLIVSQFGQFGNALWLIRGQSKSEILQNIYERVLSE